MPSEPAGLRFDVKGVGTCGLVGGAEGPQMAKPRRPGVWETGRDYVFHSLSLSLEPLTENGSVFKEEVLGFSSENEGSELFPSRGQTLCLQRPLVDMFAHCSQD